MKIVALAGGVGGAKLVDGLARVLPARDLTVVVNTGDDFDMFGLRVCPDLDTVCYTLGGLSNPHTGWGRAGESWAVFEQLQRMGAPGWFHLGDLDLATHLERTRRLGLGEPLSAVTRALCVAWGVPVAVLPMTDQRVETIVDTLEYGPLAFQNYFVEHGCRPVVRGFTFAGVEQARPAPGVLEAITSADAVIIAPSNPWVSIGPILAVPGIRPALRGRPVLAVSPIVGGKALKGPAAKMYSELGIQPSALAVARHYGDLLAGFALDRVDAEQSHLLRQWSIIPLVTDTIMTTVDDRARLAQECLDTLKTLR